MDLRFAPDAVDLVSIDAVRAYARNPRVHTDEQVAKIAASLVEFGWTVPVLIDDAGEVIAGHGRIAAARQLGQMIDAQAEVGQRQIGLPAGLSRTTVPGRRRRLLRVALGRSPQTALLHHPAGEPAVRLRRPLGDGGGARRNPIESCTIIVCEANPTLRPIHDRMPVILDPDAFDPWLNANAKSAAIKALLKPFAGLLKITPVGPRVNNVRNDDPDCLDPVTTGDVIVE